MIDLHRLSAGYPNYSTPTLTRHTAAVKMLSQGNVRDTVSLGTGHRRHWQFVLQPKVPENNMMSLVLLHLYNLHHRGGRVKKKIKLLTTCSREDRRPTPE